MTPQWVYLKDPVPQVVANRAAQLLKTPGLRIHMAWIEPTSVQCAVRVADGVPPLYSMLLRFTCEDHGHGITGISVYGLV